MAFWLSDKVTEAKHPLKRKWSNPKVILRIAESVTYTYAPTTVLSVCEIEKPSTLFKELVEHSWDIELMRASAALFEGILALNAYLKIPDGA